MSGFTVGILFLTQDQPDTRQAVCALSYVAPLLYGCDAEEHV